MSLRVDPKNINTLMTTDAELTAGLALKYDASNPSGFETPSQLNTRDTNNRARGNHTGTQLASTISDFTSSVRGTVLSGLSTATATIVSATDTVLAAIGYLQAQINANVTAIGLRALASRLVSAGTGLSGGGDLTADRTISMPNVGTAGTYGSADKYNAITTDAQGRVTNVVPTAISILASQVSNFASSVLGTALSGLSTATNTVISTTDSVLVALGKIQAQITANLNVINAYGVNTVPQATGSANTTGTSTALAKADHIHNTVLQNYDIKSIATVSTSSTTDVALVNGSITNPAAGTYLAICFINGSQSQGTAGMFNSLYVAGTQVPNTEQYSNRGGSQANITLNYTVAVPIQLNGSQSIEMRTRADAGTVTLTYRSLTLIRIG